MLTHDVHTQKSNKRQMLTHVLTQKSHKRQMRTHGHTQNHTGDKC